MELRVVRNEFFKDDTQGHLFIDDVEECATLEPIDRGLNTDMALEEILKIKVPRLTAIPVNTPAQPEYEVVKEYWPAPHNKDVPTLVNVPGYSGVGIHSVGTAADTAGCLGVGTKSAGENLIAGGFAARDAVYAKIFAAWERGEKVTISYERDPEAWAESELNQNFKTEV